MLLIPLSSFAQIERDTLIARDYILQGDSLKQIGIYDSALIYHSKSKVLYEKI